MIDTITRYLSGIASVSDRNALAKILNPIADRESSGPLSTAGLVIKAGGSALAKTGASAFYAIAQGKLVKIAASTDMPALVGTVTNAKFNVFCFFVTSGGTVTSAMGTEGATLAAVKFPPIPVGAAQVGFIIINPTGTGNFVGGTTALDDATVVPNAVFLSPAGSYDTTIVI